jgi:RimJ/RimL family protein N-acetyltransferase
VPEDRDALLAAAGRRAVVGAYSTRWRPGPDTIDFWLEYTFRERSHGRGMPFTVLDASGTIVGSTRYLRMNQANRRVEIGGTFYGPARAAHRAQHRGQAAAAHP